MISKTGMPMESETFCAIWLSARFWKVTGRGLELTQGMMLMSALAVLRVGFAGADFARLSRTVIVRSFATRGGLPSRLLRRKSGPKFEVSAEIQIVQLSPSRCGSGLQPASLPTLNASACVSQAADFWSLSCLTHHTCTGNRLAYRFRHLAGRTPSKEITGRSVWWGLS